MIVAAFGVIVGAFLVMWAVGAVAGRADDDSDAMWEEMQRIQKEMEAWERITKS